MEFDIIVATRNRQQVLETSLPLMLAQNRLPGRLIIVDASDDHSETAKIIDSVTGRSRAPVEVRLLQSEPGITRQRNVGLRCAASPVVLFPDDDALWFPGFTDALMRIYERDRGEVIGGVGGTESPFPPPGMLEGVRRRTDGLSVKVPDVVEKAASRVETRFFTDPFLVLAWSLYRDKEIPGWLGEEKASAVSEITGFRMSFRTEAIKTAGFDEALTRYGLFEDQDACTSILASRCLARAEGAKVFHYRSTEKRADEAEFGMMTILNRAYIVCKHAPPGFPLRHTLSKYTFYKLVRYLLRSPVPSGRRRLLGAWRAARCLPLLWSCPRDELANRYGKIREGCLARLRKQNREYAP